MMFCNLRQFTDAELSSLIEHVRALTAMRAALPVELFIKLDTYQADLCAEQEDRAGRGGQVRPRWPGGGGGSAMTARVVCAAKVIPGTW
jgi:hypothetical protein